MTLNCDEVKRIWLDFIGEQLSPGVEELVRVHIESCSGCSRRLEREMMALSQRPGTGGGPGQQVREGLDDATQIRIFRLARWKNRLLNAFFSAAVLLLILSLVVVSAGLYFGIVSRNRIEPKNFHIVISAVTEMTLPNVTVDEAAYGYDSFQSKGVFILRKTVGKEKIPVGLIESKTFLQRIEINRSWEAGVHDLKLFFVHPVKASYSSGEDDANGNQVWQTLTALPDGTVGELAVSFDRAYSLEEATQLFEGYDLHLVWYAIDTGQEKSAASAPLYASQGNIWGLPDQSWLGNGYYHYNQEAESEVKAEAFIRRLELLSENRAQAELIFLGCPGSLLIDERLLYVREFGVQAYGAVVTGPTKELLRLRELEEVRFPALGEIEWWNWEGGRLNDIIYSP